MIKLSSISTYCRIAPLGENCYPNKGNWENNSGQPNIYQLGNQILQATAQSKQT